MSTQFLSHTETIFFYLEFLPFFVCILFKMYSGHPKIHAVAIVSKIQFMSIVLDIMPINVWIIELNALFRDVKE